MAADPGVNEVMIRVVTEDGGKAARDAIRAQNEELARQPVVIPVTASDPITEAWRAKVNAEIKSAAREALNIPVTAETEEFRAQVVETLASMRDIAREQIPLEATNADVFRESVLAAVEETRMEIGAIVVPVEVQRPSASEVPQLMGAGEQPQEGLSSVRPGYTPAPVNTAGMYAAAAAQIENETPIELPVRAKNPIDDAFLGQLRSSIRGISADALSIPLNPDLVPFQTQLEETLAQLMETTRADIPVDVGDAMEFRAQVAELVAQVEASTKAVIDVQVNDGALSDLQSKTVAASQAEMEMVQASQKLNDALASGDEGKIAQARTEVTAATKEASEASKELAVAQEAAAAAAGAAAEGEQAAARAGMTLGAAMGPLWMLMNVAQIAMMGFGFSSSNTSQQVQDVSQSIINLGQATGQTAQGLAAGNASVKGIAGDLQIAGSSATQFSQAYVTGVAQATTYTNKLAQQQKDLANQPVHLNYATDLKKLDDAIGEGAANVFAASHNVDQLTDAANRNHAGYLALTPALKQVVDQYNALHDAVPQAKDALNSLTSAAAQQDATLASLGVHLSDGQKNYENYGGIVQKAAKALMDAEAGSTYLEDSTDKASIAAGQAQQNWKQLQNAVTQASQAYDQAKLSVSNAEHSVETASQGVDAARHAEQQAVLAVQTAQTAYTNSLYQEQQAQQAVTQARQAAEQQLVSLQLQANDAAASVEGANVSLFTAQQNASKYGVNGNNAQQIAGEQITASNEAQVAAAVALIQAENQLADAQNSSGTAQTSLNTARQQGVDNNPQVLSAEHALEQAHQGVATASQGVTNAQYAQQQAVLAVANAEWGLQQAEQSVTTAKNAEAQASIALQNATDAASRSTDANTLRGAQNRQMLEQIFQAYQNATGSEQIADTWTHKVGESMGFTSQQIGDVIGSLLGLNGTHAKFSIEGTPSMNLMELRGEADQIGLDINSMLGAHAVGGPTGSGMALVGERGPEIVRLAPGSQVVPAANTAGMLKGFAAGGAVGSLDNPMTALAANFPMAAGWAAWDSVAQTAHVMGGGPAPQLPAPGNKDLGSFAAMAAAAGAGAVAASGSAAQAQAYAASQLARHGWGPEQMPPLRLLWNQESGWNDMAVNPSSGAYGIPQSLGHGHPYALGDYVGQVDWGEDYIAGRYGNPANAWAHERAYNWYAGGGPASGGLAVVGEHGVEAVSTDGRGFGGGQQISLSAQLTVAPGADGAVATMIKNLVRTGQIMLTVTGSRVVAS